MKPICKFILFIVLVLLVLSLCACNRQQPVSETISDNAVTATTALEQSLPKECKTDAILTQFTVIKTEIRNAKNACVIEKDTITQEKRKWQWAFWGLVVLIGAYIARKVLK